MRPNLPILLLAAWGGGAAATSTSVRTVYTFPPRTFVENIAVRANSHLLLTSMSVPSLFSLDPTTANPSASIVHTFPNCTGLSGIAELVPDVFAVVTATWDLAATRAALGSLAVWTVDLARSPPRIALVARVPDSTILNGVARHPMDHRVLLAADSAAGAIWSIDTRTGASVVVVSSPLLLPTGTAAEGKHLGINGLQAAGRWVYLTNSAQGFFGRVAVGRAAGTGFGAVEVLANATDAAADVVYDDFALDVDATAGKGHAWIASHPDYAVRVPIGVPGPEKVVRDAALLKNPTAAALGRGRERERKTLYVTNGGEFTAEGELVNGGVVAIDL